MDLVQDDLQGFLQGIVHLVAVDGDAARRAVGQVASSDFHLLDGLRPIRVADGVLDQFRGGFADQQPAVSPYVLDDAQVEVVAAGAGGVGEDDVVERQHRDFRGAAADVQDEVATGLLDVQARAQRGQQRFLVQVDLARAGGFRSGPDRPAFHLGGAARHADQDPRPDGEQPSLARLSDEVLQHLLGAREIRHHAVAQRSHHLDVGGGSADHAFGLGADGFDFGFVQVRILADGDHRRLIKDDSFAGYVHERVGGAQIDGHVVAEKTPEHGKLP